MRQDYQSRNTAAGPTAVSEVYALRRILRRKQHRIRSTRRPNAISSLLTSLEGGYGATPDCRKGVDILADASLSPDHGKDTQGPIAVFQSAMRVNQDPYQGTLLNMKLHPTSLKTDADLMKLGSMIKTYLTNGGKHVQFNVVGRAEMEDAKVHPEDHSELVVRVAGYSAYFTRLPVSIQDEVINRSEQKL